ncbi:MAG: hypothetical protein IH845_00415, partial [Nanoarchaeota archaeon]|nr:hypothetical protein [Nanoarchaeota archaeon]
SANSNMDSQTLVVSPIASFTSLSFDVSSPQDFGVAITPTCSVVSGDGSAVLTLDGVVISSGVSLTPGAGSLSFNCSLSASQNYSSSENVSVYTVSPISSIVNLTLNSSSSDITIFAGDSINLGCSVVAGDSLAVIEMYREGLLINSGNSPVNNLTTFSIVQVENVTCSYKNSQNYTTSFETFFVNVTPVPDTTPPVFTTIPLDANINYGDLLSVDFDASDETLFDSFLINWSDTFSINSAGLLVNVSPLSGGSYSINVSINDSSGNVNWTIYSVTVNPISPSLSFVLTPSNSEDYGITVTSTGSGCPSQLSCVLYRDSVAVTNGESVSLSAGSYNYDYNTTGNVNYTNGFASDTLTVSPVSPVGSLTNSTSWTVDYGTLITVGLVESNTGDFDVTYTIYRDGVSVETGETVSLSAGTYNYILNTSGGVNYSANSNMDSQTLIVSLIASSTSLSFDVSSPQDFGVAITPSCSVLVGDGSAVLTLDGSVISSGVSITPGASSMSFNCSLAASTNYGSSESISIYTVNQVSSVVNLTLNSISEDITIFAGDSINLGCSIVTGDSLATVELYREGSLIDSGVSPLNNLTTFNIVQVENITCSYVNSANYTTSFETFFVNVTPVSDTTPPFFTTIPATANINKGEILSVDFDAADDVLFDSFSINWTDTFSINSVGLLVNTSPLSGGSYSINVSINDSSSNINWTLYLVVVNEIFIEEEISGCRSLNVANTSYYLIQDIIATEDCLIVGAENITINFGGYNITGNSSGNGVYSIGQNNLIIKNGEIYDFENGINIVGGNQNQIENMILTSNPYGVILSSVIDTILINNVITNSAENGIRIFGGSNNSLSGNNFSGNSIDFSSSPGSLKIFSLNDIKLEMSTLDIKIVWDDRLNFTSNNLGDAIEISPNRLFVNSSLIPSLNRSARIKINNTDSLNFVDRISLINGAICPSSICVEVSDADIYVFDVAYFSDYIYSIGEGNIGGESSGGGGGPSVSSGGQASIIETIINKNQREEVCLLCSKSLKKHIQRRGNIDYDSEELETLTLEINREIKSPVTMEEINFVLQNFEEECDSYLPLFGGLAIGRSRELSTVVVFISAFFVLLFFIFLYFALRKIRKIKSSRFKRKEKRK